VGFVFVVIGVLLIAYGIALILNIRGATDWFVEYGRSQRQVQGRLAVQWTSRGVRAIGVVVLFLGAMFLAYAPGG
jgi:hypothetical protein